MTPHVDQSSDDKDGAGRVLYHRWVNYRRAANGLDPWNRETALSVWQNKAEDDRQAWNGLAVFIARGGFSVPVGGYRLGPDDLASDEKQDTQGGTR